MPLYTTTSITTNTIAINHDFVLAIRVDGIVMPAAKKQSLLDQTQTLVLSVSQVIDLLVGSWVQGWIHLYPFLICIGRTCSPGCRKLTPYFGICCSQPAQETHSLNRN